MSERSFEHQLHRLYAEAPPAPDAALFASRLVSRLDLAWTLRRLAIGVAAAGSAGLAAWQLAGSMVAARVEEALRTPFAPLGKRLALLGAEAPLLRVLPFSTDVVWLLGGLVLLAAGLLAARAVDEI